MSQPSRTIRQNFIDFFVKHDHAFVPTSPVVPLDDPTLLFTNAGMNQFKDVFLGTGNRSYKRAANSQKCIRAGGKHNDLDDVGHDTYHHTFFEMLGNWSFGDYFKEESIRWAWQLLHEQWGIPAERLHATYFAGDEADSLPPDEEARQLWLDVTGIEEKHVHAFGKKDNFWEMADTGPCGPCTEIHVDLTPDLSGGPLVNADDPRVFEVWNLVFIQFNREAGGNLLTLPAKHVDTGMGFERLTTVLQGKKSNYDTDIFSPLMEAILRETGAPAYGGRLVGSEPSEAEMRDVAYRICADHLRCLTVAIADGAEPEGDGRGYVLRRILRRAYRYGRQYLGVHRPFLFNLVPAVTDSLGDAFPELRGACGRVQGVIYEEEKSFACTLDNGLKLFTGAAKKAMQSGGTIDGDVAFKLHDTYGFPIDLTQIIASERGLKVDEEGFLACMEAARELARNPAKEIGGGAKEAILEALARVSGELFDQGPTDDSPKRGLPGPDAEFEHASQILGWLHTDGSSHGTAEVNGQGGSLETGRDVAIVLRSTCFYAEQGGQVGDTGEILGEAGGRFEVVDTQRGRDTVLHIGRLVEGTLRAGERVIARLSGRRRRSIMSNHTATHLLNHGLREVLGDHVQQKGSLVDAEKTRFDFSHRGSLAVEEIESIEAHVNSQIEADHLVYHAEMPLVDALAIDSLRGVFGERYPEIVRVVSIGLPVDRLQASTAGLTSATQRTYSIELCGGTHHASTSHCGAFTLISDEPVSKGVRRIVAFTGERAQEALDSASSFAHRADALERQQGGEPLEAGVAALANELVSKALPIRARQRLGARLESLQERVRQARRNEAAQRQVEIREVSAQLLETAAVVGGVKLVVGPVPEAPVAELRTLSIGCGRKPAHR